MSNCDHGQNEPRANGDGCWKQIGVFGDGSCPELEQVVHCRNCPVFAAAGERLFERASPKQYVAQWTDRLAADKAEEHEDRVAAVLFRVREEWFAVETDVVVEIANPRPIRRVPHRSDSLLLGLVNIRGELQLCVDPCTLLELTDTPDTGSVDSNAADGERSTARLLVMQQGENRWVVTVDEVAGVTRIDRTSITNVPSTVGKSRRCYTKGVFNWNNQKVGYLDEKSVFESLERAIG